MDRDELQADYEEMAKDVEHETEALEWCEALIADVSFDEPESRFSDGTGAARR